MAALRLHMTIRQEAAFLKGALHTGDPVLERRLLIGHGLLRAARTWAEGGAAGIPPVADLLSAIDRRDFVGAASHLQCLRALASSFDIHHGSRREVHAALVEYGCRLAFEDHTACALAVL